MADKDVALAILGASIGLAGLLLVFIGFLLAKADQQDLKSKRSNIRTIAVVGLLPFVACLLCAWQSIWTVQGAHESAMWLFASLKIVIALTGLYAIMATFYELR